MVVKCRRCKGPWIPEGDLYCDKCNGDMSSIITKDYQDALSKNAEYVGQVAIVESSIFSIDRNLELNKLKEAALISETSSQGKKFDQDKPAMGLIPARAAEEEGHVWAHGAAKYGEAHNWRKGLTVLRICGAILRHTFAIMRGEDIDKDSGRHHGACIRCDAGMLIEFYYEGRTELDDRYKFKDI